MGNTWGMIRKPQTPVSDNVLVSAKVVAQSWMDAVQKVIEKNTESTFKTFG